MELIDDILTKYGNTIIERLRNDIKNKPLPRRGGDSYPVNASGKLADDLNFTVEDGVLKIYANKYIYYLVYGRKPNKNQDPAKVKAWVGWAGSTFLKDWVEAKGLSISPFAVAYSIAKKGNSFNPQGSTLLSDIINDSMVNNLKSEIFLTMSDNIFDSFATLKRAA